MQVINSDSPVNVIHELDLNIVSLNTSSDTYIINSPNYFCI